MIRAAVRSFLAFMGRRVDRRVCEWPNMTGGDDEE